MSSFTFINLNFSLIQRNLLWCFALIFITFYQKLFLASVSSSQVHRVSHFCVNLKSCINTALELWNLCWDTLSSDLHSNVYCTSNLKKFCSSAWFRNFTLLAIKGKWCYFPISLLHELFLTKDFQMTDGDKCVAMVLV